jgi:hypothetical protein
MNKAGGELNKTGGELLTREMGNIPHGFGEGISTGGIQKSNTTVMKGIAPEKRSWWCGVVFMEWVEGRR